MLFNWQEMKPTTIEFQMELVVTQSTGIYLVLVEDTLVLVSHDAKKFIIHVSLLKTVHKIFFLHEVNDSVAKRPNIEIVEFPLDKL